MTFWSIRLNIGLGLGRFLRPKSGGATPGRARSNDLAGRSTALAPPCLLPVPD